MFIANILSVTVSDSENTLFYSQIKASKRTLRCANNSYDMFQYTRISALVCQTHF